MILRGFVPRTQALLVCAKRVDGRVKPGQDEAGKAD